MPTTTAAATEACRCWYVPVRLHERHCCFTDDTLCHQVPDDLRAEILTRLRAAWDAPFLADPSDQDANAARSQLTRYLADVILSSPLRATAGGLTIATAGWSKQRGDYADSVADSATDPTAWIAALGQHEDAVLTSDGRPAVRTTWCADPGDFESWARYEAWSAAGCEAHGFVCADCRKLTQTG